MRRVHFFPYLFSFSFYVLTFSLYAKTDFPFIPGERLDYELSWGFIPVGSAVIEIGPRDSSSNAPWQICFSVRTNSFADKFYKVRTKVTSWVDCNFTHSLKYVKSQHEGKTRKEIQVNFDYSKNQVTYLENEKPPRILPLSRKVYDPLAIAFAFRCFPTEAGKAKILPTCDGKKFLDVRIKVGKREDIKVPFGCLPGNDVTPDMKDLSGVFKKSPKGILRVWYSDDYRKIPLKISSKVVFGSFTAELISAQNLQKK